MAEGSSRLGVLTTRSHGVQCPVFARAVEWASDTQSSAHTPTAAQAQRGGGGQVTSPIRTAVESQQAMYTQYCITMRALTIADPAAARVLSDYIRLLREENAARRVAARERRERETGERR